MLPDLLSFHVLMNESDRPLSAKVIWVTICPFFGRVLDFVECWERRTVLKNKRRGKFQIVRRKYMPFSISNLKLDELIRGSTCSMYILS